jgi:hypothetical protein
MKASTNRVKYIGLVLGLICSVMVLTPHLGFRASGADDKPGKKSKAAHASAEASRTIISGSTAGGAFKTGTDDVFINAGEMVTTFDATCTTPDTTFDLGDTVCAQVTMFDPMAFTARFDWVDPDGIIQEMGPTIVANGQTDTFVIPSMGPNAKTGTWKVQITNLSDASVITFQNFTVSGGGGGGPAVATFESTCTTPQTAFNLGDTVCAQATIDPMAFNARFDWVDPDGIIQEMGPTIVASGQTDTFVIPSMGPNAKTGTWKVQLTNLADASVIAFQNFTVMGGGGPAAEAIATFESTCTTPQSAFTAGATVCAQVTGIDAGEENTFRIDWVDPNLIVVEMGPIVTMNNQTDTFTIPAAGPDGTWKVQLTRLSDAAAQASANFTVTGSGGGGGCTSITCPANITVSNTAGQCGANVNYPAPTPNGTCGDIMCSPASGSFFDVGTTTVTCTSTAGPGCSFTITVVDTEPPMIDCPDNVTTVTPAPNQTGAIVTFPPPTASDNCPGVTTSCTPPSGSIFPAGTTTVTCTATDASGNTATCSFTVTVFDVCLQDATSPNRVLLFNSFTGEYIFCCGSLTVTGTGTVTKMGSDITLQHNAATHRVMGKVSTSSRKGSASLQKPPGNTACTITDPNIRDNTCACGAVNGV